jgi:hypothetical protein
VGKRHRRIRARSATGHVAGAATEKPGLEAHRPKRPAQPAFSRTPLSQSPEPKPDAGCHTGARAPVSCPERRHSAPLNPSRPRRPCACRDLGALERPDAIGSWASAVSDVAFVTRRRQAARDDRPLCPRDHVERPRRARTCENAGLARVVGRRRVGGDVLGRGSRTFAMGNPAWRVHRLGGGMVRTWRRATRSRRSAVSSAMAPSVRPRRKSAYSPCITSRWWRP